MSRTTVEINRAPVLTLWAAVVAERLGHSRETALSLGKVVSGLNAQKKGRSLGIYRGGADLGAGGEPKTTGLGEDRFIELLGRPVPVKQTDDGLRGVVKDQPVEPAKVDTYLQSKFGEALEEVVGALRELAESYEPKQLERVAYELYEVFRPEIPKGRKGWGIKGTLDLGRIRAMARREG